MCVETTVRPVLSRILSHDGTRMCSQRKSVSQRIKLLCPTQSSRGRHLAFAHHMHELSTSMQTAYSNWGAMLGAASAGTDRSTGSSAALVKENGGARHRQV